jgi:hypothetical protein
MRLMIVGTFGRYLLETAHDHETTMIGDLLGG